MNPKHGRTRSLRRASCLEWGRFLTLTRNSDCAVHANEENVQHALGIRALCSDQTRTGCVVDGFSQVVLCFHGLNSCCCERLLNAWQIWGLDDRELMATILQLMHSLVSPHNSKVSHRRWWNDGVMKSNDGFDVGVRDRNPVNGYSAQLCLRDGYRDYCPRSSQSKLFVSALSMKMLVLLMLPRIEKYG